MLSFLTQSFTRSETATQHPLYTDGGASITEFLPPNHEHDSFCIRQTFLKEKMVKLKAAGIHPVISPLYHWHLNQVEYFHVEKGSMCMKIDGKERIVTPKDGVIEIKPGVYHNFDMDPTSDDDLVFVACGEPEDGLTEKFFRNFFGYLDDCQKNKICPSIFQLLLFLYNTETFVALPKLPKFLGKWVSRWIFGYVGGKIIGESILGFQDNYPEYMLTPVVKISDRKMK